MSLSEKIKKLLNSNKTTEDKLQAGVTAVQNAYEESETKKEALQNAKNKVIEVMQTHPEMPIGEFFKSIQEQTKLSTESLVDVIKQIPDVMPEEATVEAVKKLELPSEAITEIIQEAPVSLSVAKKIVEQIPDEEIQKEQQAEIEKMLEEEQRKASLEKESEILAKLKEIQNNCEKINDSKLVTKIIDLKIDEKTTRINESILHIITKKMALDCMQFGGPRVPIMLPIMSASEMLEANLPLLVEKEYQTQKTIYDKQNKQYRTYDKQLLKNILLENIAKKVAHDFEEIGDFNVPQIDQLRDLSPEESKLFIKAVKNSCNKESLNEDDEKRIQRQLKGELAAELQDLNRVLEKMKPKEREFAIQKFMDILRTNSNKTESQKGLDEVLDNISTEIKKLPNGKKLSTANAILNVLEEQQESINMWKKHKQSEPNKKEEPEAR